MIGQDKHEIVIVRRGDEGEEVVKGGVWKIAHADFMTAMMAFFLVMWLISVSDENTRQSVANYFNPIQLATSTPNKKGLEEPQNVPLDANSNSDKEGKEKGSGEGTGGKSHQLQKPRFKEGALFQDPYAVLAKIAAEAEANPHDTLGADATPGESEVPGLNAGEVFRDPFDPLYWQVAPVTELKTEIPPKPGTAAPVPSQATVDALANSKQKLPGNGTEIKPAVRPRASDPNGGASQPAAGSPPDGEAVAQAGAADPAAPDVLTADQKTADLKAAELKKEILQAVQSSRDSSPSPVIEVRRSGSGTMISLTDDFDFSMFAVGSAEPQAKVVKSMERIAEILKTRPGKIVIRGHTDGRPFKSESYDNWRLSQARAQMALYMLVRGGLPESRIVRVEGHADRDLKIPSNPNADQNRRIEILLQE